MDDEKIREHTKKAYKKIRDFKIHSDINSGEFYYDFMKIQKGFIKKYNKVLEACGKKCYDKPILRMSDIYFWALSNNAGDKFIEY